MLEAVATPGRGDDLRPSRSPRLERARDVVVVNVRLEDPGDPPAALRGDIEKPPHVALRVDDHCLAATSQQVRGVTEPGRDEELEVHRGHRATPANRRLRCAAPTSACEVSHRSLEVRPTAAIYHARMAKIGYAAALEQFHPTDLLDWCAQADDAGFEVGV